MCVHNSLQYTQPKLTWLHRQRLQFKTKHNKAITPTQKANILDFQTQLGRSLSCFRAIQAIYMPSTTVDEEAEVHIDTHLPKQKLRDDSSGDESTHEKKKVPIEEQPLLLPSELPINLCTACHPGLDDIERQMRDTQCRVALDQIRTHLFIKLALTTFKQQHTQGQKNNTCSQKTISDND